jgi:hypothetical protein
MMILMSSDYEEGVNIVASHTHHLSYSCYYYYRVDIVLRCNLHLCLYYTTRA